MANPVSQTTDEHPAWDRYREARRELIHLNAYAAQATQRMLDAKRELELAGEGARGVMADPKTTDPDDDKPVVYEAGEMPRYLRKIGYEVGYQAADLIVRLHAICREYEAGGFGDPGRAIDAVRDALGMR